MDESDEVIPAKEIKNEKEEVMTQSSGKKDRKEVPIKDKVLLTLEEAAAYTGLGQNKLRELSNEDSCTFVLWNGGKRMFKRTKLILYLESNFSI